MFILMGKQGRSKRGKISQRDAMSKVLLNKLSPRSLPLFNDFWGGDFILIERKQQQQKIKMLVIEKRLSTEVKNVGFATRLPRFKYSLCYVLDIQLVCSCLYLPLCLSA